MTFADDWRNQNLNAQELTLLKVLANTYYNGDMDAAWQATLRQEREDPPVIVHPQDNRTRVHLKATKR